MFFVFLCARFQENLKLSQYNAAKHILKYLKGTPCLSLWYPKEFSFNLIGYSGEDCAGGKTDKKITSGSC